MSDPTPTLDDVYEKYKVGDQRQPEQSAPQPTATSPESDLTQQLAALTKDVSAIRADNEQLRTDSAKAQEKADLQNVLEKLSAKLEGVNSKHIKYALAERYEDDDKFRQVWSDRANNPEAFNAALDALVPILQQDMAVKADPKIAADQRAFDNALQSADAPGPGSESDDETHRLMKLNESDFNAEWQKMVR